MTTPRLFPRLLTVASRRSPGTTLRKSVRPLGRAIEQLDERIVLDDTIGAHVTSTVFSGATTGIFDRVRVTFSESMHSIIGFATPDVLGISGPSGAISGIDVAPVFGFPYTTYDVTFQPQSTPGTYTLHLSSNIYDATLNDMDQNQNGTNGEDGLAPLGDEFHTTATLTAPTTPPVSALGGSDGTVRIINSNDGTPIAGFRPLDATGAPYNGLVAVALGNLNSDGVPDLFVSAANPSGVSGLDAGKAGKVFVFDGAALILNQTPTLLRSFTPFATTDGPGGTNGAYINGLNIAAGDVNTDGIADLIAGTRGGNGTTSGLNEYGRLVVIDGASPAGSNNLIGSIQKPFGPGYQKGVVVAAGNVNGGYVGVEIAITRGGPVASPNPVVQQIKVKVFTLRGTTLTEIPLAADGSTAFAPFGSLAGAANAINRDGRVAFVDTNGDGKDELVFSALDPLTDPNNKQVRVGVYSINVDASASGATILSTGPDAGTYLTGKAVVDHAITHVGATQQNLALITESATTGAVYLAPLTGVQLGGFGLTVLNAGIVLDGV